MSVVLLQSFFSICLWHLIGFEQMYLFRDENRQSCLSVIICWLLVSIFTVWYHVKCLVGHEC